MFINLQFIQIYIFQNNKGNMINTIWVPILQSEI